MSVPDAFGDMIRQRRKVLGLTQQELACEIGCSRVTIQKIETQQRRPSITLAKRLANYLHLSLSEQLHLIETRDNGIWHTKSQNNISAKLPILSSPLIGREEETQVLFRHMVESRTRLLTIIGPPGVGKTSLAIQVATTLQSHYADGVILVSLESIHDPILVLYEVAQALDIRDAGRQPVLEVIRLAAQERRLLILLDNFEHLIDAASDIAMLLACTPHIDLMVTSRVRLGIGSEYAYTVQPLCVLPDACNTPVELLKQSPAVTLFTIRAQAVNTYFALTDANAVAVVEICRRLDGLPLAIELAAARSLFLTPHMLLNQLDQKLAFLVSGPADLPQRQQTLVAAIDWSYQLLTEEEQRLLRHLAVFAGSCSLSALAAIYGVMDFDGHTGVQLLHTLYGLVQHSLVYTTVTESGEMHYRMLDTIRSYARKELIIHEDMSHVLRRHADYYHQLANQARSHFRGPAAKVWVSRLTEAFPDLRCAFQWLLQHDVTSAVHVLIAGSSLFYRYTHVAEGRQLIASALKQCDNDVIEPILHGELHQLAGNLAYMQGEYTLGQAHLQQALDLYLHAQHTSGMIKIANHLGNLALRQGRFGDADTWYTQSLVWARAHGDTRLICIPLYGLAQLAGATTSWDQAQALYQEGLELRTQQADRWGMAVNLLGLGNTLRQSNQVEAARKLCELSLKLWQEIEDPRGMAGVLHALGHIALEQDAMDQAYKYFVESTRAWQKLSMSLELGWSLEAFARLAVRQNQTNVARQLFRAATFIRTQLQSPRTPAENVQLAAVIHSVSEQGDQCSDDILSMSTIQQMLEELMTDKPTTIVSIV